MMSLVSGSHVQESTRNFRGGSLHSFRLRAGPGPDLWIPLCELSQVTRPLHGTNENPGCR